MPIVIATLAHVGSFDFGARPGGLIYLGAYIATGLIAAFSVWWYRSRSRASTSA